jgi:hypothetical protein
VNAHDGQLPQEKMVSVLRTFADLVLAKSGAAAAGEPEDQLGPPMDQLFHAYGQIVGQEIVLKGQSRLKDRLGKPDFAAHAGRLLVGHIELKAPGKGANPERFKGHDREQWQRFKNLPNLIYTDGNEWALYRDGKQEGKLVRLQGDVCADGAGAVSAADARSVFGLLAAFTSWTPIVPTKPKELAEFLAPYCGLIRDEVLDALQDQDSSLQRLKIEIKQLLFPDATDQQFADNYAQTVIFALLLAHMEGADVLDLHSAYEKLASHHLLLSRSLEFLTRDKPQEELRESLTLAQRVIHEVRQESLLVAERLIPDAAEPSPWLFFYEHFLAKYDPALRKAWGVYYTPLEVVGCQVRLVEEILRGRLGQKWGFAESRVLTLDPAMGTGTYLLTIFDHALERIETEEGAGAAKGGARTLVTNLHGFEWMVGPYAVAQLRFERALVSRKVDVPISGLGMYLTNTLESPHTKPPAPAYFHEPIAHEHRRALRIKEHEPVLICIGNPPYGRHEAAEALNKAVTGGWVRHGDSGSPAILEDFLEPARKAGLGVHLKNLYNLYVYFIRWAVWKVFEQSHPQVNWPGAGIVSFITCSSYLDGDAFVGLREHMRRVCDHIDIIDLGGEGRGTRQDENVFDIQTPVAIFVAWRKSWKEGKKRDIPATVRYTRIEGTREEKLRALNRIKSQEDVKWLECPTYWQGPFKPESKGAFTKWPLITDLLPWQSNGVQLKRTWPTGPSEEVLAERWQALLKSSDRGAAMRDSGDRTAAMEQKDLFDSSATLPPIQRLDRSTPCQRVVAYAYRSFDRQFLIADNRLISRPRPPLWLAHGKKQLYISSMLYAPLGKGPALSAAAAVPDLHFFCNRGAKDILPLYRDAAAKEPNLLPCLLHTLGAAHDRTVTPEDVAGYVYAMLAQPEYTSRFARQLATCEVRVPLTKDGKLFHKAAEFGKRLLWLHTYGERFSGKGRPEGQAPTGRAKCLEPVSESEAKYPNEFHYIEAAKTLEVGDGRFGPVAPEVFEFEVSGLKAVKSWLGYRMRERSGKKSSPLDDIRPKSWTHQFTRELLELLWVLEATVDGYPEQKKLLDQVLESRLFTADELPEIPAESRKPPKPDTSGQANFEF